MTEGPPGELSNQGHDPDGESRPGLCSPSEMTVPAAGFSFQVMKRLKMAFMLSVLPRLSFKCLKHHL